MWQFSDLSPVHKTNGGLLMTTYQTTNKPNATGLLALFDHHNEELSRHVEWERSQGAHSPNTIPFAIK